MTPATEDLSITSPAVGGDESATGMRIAIIHPFQLRYARGIERLTWALSSHLVKRSVEVDILTWQWPNPLDWGSAPRGLRIRKVPDFRYYMRWVAVPYYASWLAGLHYDWVMVYFAGYGEGAALRILDYLRPQRRCVVLQYPVEQAPQRYMEFKRWGMGQSADRVIAPSSFVARGAEAAFQRPCEIIGNGVDPVQFQVTAGERQQARRRFGVEESDPVIVSLAALEERKGLQWVIRALPRLLAEFPSLRYWIVGEGSYRESLEAQIRNLGLERHVWLAGAVANVVPLLAAADVGCLLSKGEAFGITLLEYMAMELPVVTSCHPAFDELVTSSWGEMVTETETGQVARTLAALLRDPLRRRALGRAGRQHVLANYTWDQVADRYLRVLETGERSAGVFSHA